MCETKLNAWAISNSFLYCVPTSEIKIRSVLKASAKVTLQTALAAIKEIKVKHVLF